MNPSDMKLLPSVTSGLTYIHRPAEPPVTYMHEPPAGVPRENWAADVRPCQIEDARPVLDALQLDRDGFTLLKHRTSAIDLSDSEVVKAVYYPEVEELVETTLGASRVVVFDHAVRKREPSKQKLGFGRQHSVLQPVGRIHCDYTLESGPRRMREALGDEVSTVEGLRYCQVNLWRTLREPIVDAPLAVCAAWSVAPDDRISCELRYESRCGQLYLAAYNARHRWFYFPNMASDEVLLFKGYDSDGKRARFTFHSAFEHPDAPAEALPRQSIEVRAFAFF